MADVVIFGAGDIARLAHVYFTRDSRYTVAAFTVDREYRSGDEFEGLPLVAFDDVPERFPPDRFQMFVALGYARMNRVRAATYERARGLGYTLVSYVSSRCAYFADSPPGDNCFILENTTVQPFARIGNDVTLWSGASIAHDSVVEDHCFLASQVSVSGHTRIRSHCFIGANATVRNGIELAPETLVGAGAVITKSTVAKSVHVPKRAEVLPQSSDEIEP